VNNHHTICLTCSIENELIWTCKRHGIGIIPRAPIGTGILSGKYRKQGTQPPAGRFTEFGTRLTPEVIDVAEALKPLAREKGISLAEFSLAWVMRQPGITAPIIGIRTMEHLKAALKTL